MPSDAKLVVVSLVSACLAANAALFAAAAVPEYTPSFDPDRTREAVRAVIDDNAAATSERRLNTCPLVRTTDLVDEAGTAAWGPPNDHVLVKSTVSPDRNFDEVVCGFQVPDGGGDLLLSAGFGAIALPRGPFDEFEGGELRSGELDANPGCVAWWKDDASDFFLFVEVENRSPSGCASFLRELAPGIQYSVRRYVTTSL
jgi:hypothetical protein